MTSQYGQMVGANAVLVSVLLAVEIVLDVAAYFVRDRENATAHLDSAHRVVCVGDSHTYGALVAAAASYPAQLQQLLDAKEPNRFDVINLGVRASIAP